MSDSYDLALVGTGFASAFFLHEALRRLPASSRILVIERGRRVPHAERVANQRRPPAERKEMTPPAESLYGQRSGVRKTWMPSATFGGGSNCWWACTPRMLPEDFQMRSRYGVGSDWPVSYDALEEDYVSAERLMAVSGPSEGPFPRSAPYPQPPHRFSEPERILKAAFPDHFFHQPCARPTRAVASGRPACCASGVCGLCPIDSKFTIENEMAGLFEDPRVTLELSCAAQAVEMAGGRATGVRYTTEGGRERVARADLVALGAGAMFNPWLLLRSGLGGSGVGEGLVEQTSVTARVDLDGVDNFQGSTAITGNGYMFYSGEHRALHAAALVETASWPSLRAERGRWRQRLEVKLIFEDLREARNRVTQDTEQPSKPSALFAGRSAYCQRGIDQIPALLKRLLAPLPVTDVWLSEPSDTEGHILGTTVMGDDPAASVVDAGLVHHRVRNLVLLGSGAFPTAAPANPTLTLCALSLRSARRLLSSRGEVA